MSTHALVTGALRGLRSQSTLRTSSTVIRTLQTSCNT